MPLNTTVSLSTKVFLYGVALYIQIHSAAGFKIELNSITFFRERAAVNSLNFPKSLMGG